MSSAGRPAEIAGPIARSGSVRLASLPCTAMNQVLERPGTNQAGQLPPGQGTATSEYATPYAARGSGQTSRCRVAWVPGVGWLPRTTFKLRRTVVPERAGAPVRTPVPPGQLSPY